MTTKKLPHLLDATDSVLVVIDVQDLFLKRLRPEDSQRVVTRIRWLIQLAHWLDIPCVVTAEDLERDGPTTAALRQALPPESRDMNKVVFGLAGQPDILAAVAETGRRTAVLVGLETDVCVQHSAFGLAALGYEVAVVVDATASPDIGHEIGIGRMRDAGIALVSVKSLFFEWVRDLDRCHRFFREAGVETPQDLWIG
jgi:nicotinamidase-related amidase